MSSRFDQPFTLASMSDAFPDGLPTPPKDLPEYVSMDFNTFCSRLRLAHVGTFEIPISNVNQHEFQRTIDNNWVTKLQGKFGLDGRNAFAHPGVGILNTEDVPKGADGRPDGSQMRITLISAGHRSSAVAGMPSLAAHEKVWVYEVYTYDLHFATDSLLHLWISSQNQTSERLVQKMTQNVDIILMVANEAYTPQNSHTNLKITNGVAHLEKEVKDLIKPLVNNPRLVRILMKISKIPLWRSGLISMAGLRNLLECRWSPEMMAEIFEDVYRQAEVITDGHVERLTLADFTPKWTMSSRQIRTYRVLPTEPYASWSAGMKNIEKDFKDKVPPVPNYFQNCGGMDVINRISSSTQSYVIGDQFYHPAYYVSLESPLRQRYTNRKIIFGGLAYIIGGRGGWDETTWSNSTSKKIHAFPSPLSRRMDGPLLRYVTDYQGLSDEYDFDDLAAKSSEIMTKIITMIDSQVGPLSQDFYDYITKPLRPLLAKHNVEKFPLLEDTLLRPEFIRLILASESWYQLLLVIGFEPGDALPFTGTDLWTLPTISPADVVSSQLIGLGNKLVKTIDTKLTEKEEESRTRFEAEKVKQAKEAEAALKVADDKRLRREKEQLRDEEALQLKLIQRQQLAVEEKAEESARSIAANATIRNRLAQFKDVTKRLEDTVGSIPAKDLAEIKAFCSDPMFAEFLEEDSTKTTADVPTSGLTNIADVFNLIARHENSQRLHSAVKASTSSSISHRTSASSSTSYPAMIDLTISDDFDAGGKMVIDDYVKDFSWKPIGVKPEHVTPILFAIKNMPRSDKALFADDANVQQILALGLKALKEQRTIGGDSSAASDSSKRSHSQGPGGGSMERTVKRLKPQKMVIDAAAFTKSVSSKKGKGKARRVTPDFTSSEDEDDDEDEDEDDNLDMDT